MKSMNRRKGKKIAVMAVIIVGLMVIAFMPAASADVTSFTVTPSTGLAGAVDSYNVLVTTDGVTSINITIPAGFIAVAPATGGVEIARVDFWNESTRDYYGYATITSNAANPTTEVDVYCKFGADEVTTPNQPVDYTASATNTFESGFPSDTSSAIIKLPTATVPGSIKISINCTQFHLDDVMIAIKQFVKNPGAGDYDFFAEDVTEVVTITNPLAYPTVYKDGLWFVDSEGDLIADICFLYGSAGANIKPLVGDLYGSADIITYGSDTGLWQVDTNHDRVTDHSFTYGGSGSKALVGDVNQDGKDDIAVVTGSAWYVDTTGDQMADLIFLYGGPGSTPLIGDVNQDGKDDIAVVTGSAWYVDTTYVPGDTLPLADLMFLYGAPGTIPLIGDADQDGKDDVVVFHNGWWFVDTNNSHTVNLQFLYGTTGMIPLVGAIR